MSADIILFVSRSNQKADRAFWKGPEPIEQMAIEIMNQTFPDASDTAEYVPIENGPA